MSRIMISTRRRIAFASLGTVLTGAGYVYSDEKRKRQAELTAASTYRVCNLLSTVATMCGDYGIDMYFKSKPTVSAYETKHEELRRLQTELEDIHTQQLEFELKNKAQDIKVNVDPFMKKIDENRIVMDKVADELVVLGAEKEHLNSAVHTRNAVRLTKMCAENGGLYIKLGQHIAMLDYIVPVEYQTELFSLLGTTPQSSIESVRRVIKEQLGDAPEKLFDTFDPVPIASASLAQVHVATKDGRKYAVKVQHDGLAESAHVDMLVVTKIVSLMSNLFEDFNYNWLSAEMNRNIPLELDFKIERANILKTTDLLRSFIDSGDVAVPTVKDEFSSTKVLCMSFEEGCYVSNNTQIQRMGLNKAHIAHTISNVFWEQIFRHGFVHCGKF